MVGSVSLGEGTGTGTGTRMVGSVSLGGGETGTGTGMGMVGSVSLGGGDGDGTGGGKVPQSVCQKAAPLAAARLREYS